MDTTPIAPEAPDAELVEFLGGEVPKAPPTEPTAPAEPAAQPEAKDGAQPRDATGKFTTTETPAAPVEAADAEPAEAPPEPVPSTPFSYRAYGADHSPFTGAMVTPEGKVEFPPDAVPRLKQVLAEGHNAESRRRQTERETQTKLVSARGANAQLVRRADMTLARLAELRRNPDALQQWFNDLDRNWDVLEAQVERDALQKELETQRTAAQEQLIRQQREALEPQLRSTLERTVGEMVGAEAELTGLNALEAAERLWSAFRGRVFQEAQQDDPGGAYRKGEILMDYDAIRAELQYEAKLRGSAKAAPPPKPAPIVPKVPVAPPPVVATKGAGARPAPKVPTFKSTAEADKWLEEGGYNDLF